jgi:hypothetical protein
MDTTRLKNTLINLLETQSLRDRITWRLVEHVERLLVRQPQRETLARAVQALEKIRAAPAPAKPLGVGDFQKLKEKGLTPLLRNEYRRLMVQVGDDAVREAEATARRLANKKIWRMPLIRLGSAFNGRAEVYRMPLDQVPGGRTLDNTISALSTRFEAFAKERFARMRKAGNKNLLKISLGVSYTDGDGLETYKNTNLVSLTASRNGEHVARLLLRNLREKFQAPSELNEGHDSSHFDPAESELMSGYIYVSEFAPARGSSYLPTPEWIALKKACVNVHNEDKRCFLWSVAAALWPADKHADRCSKYAAHLAELDDSMLVYPVCMHDPAIELFEEQNRVSVNVWRADDETQRCQVARISPVANTEGYRPVDLLYFEGKRVSLPQLCALKKGSLCRAVPEAALEANGHYLWVRNPSRLLSAQLTAHKSTAFVCRSCFKHQHNKEEHDAHVSKCRPSGGPVQYTILPPEGSTIRFKAIHKQLPFPYAIYADSEAYQRDFAGAVNNPEVRGPSTAALTQHEGASFQFCVTTRGEGWELPEGVPHLSRVFDSAREFLEELCRVGQRLKEEVQSVQVDRSGYKPMEPLTAEQERSVVETQTCHICGHAACKPVLDHCHRTGAFRGVACEACNLQYRYKDTNIPVFFHNGRGYDWHLLFKEVAYVEALQHRLSVIPRNFEQYISWSGGPLRFLDSAGFYAPGTSLEKLVAVLRQGGPLRQQFPHLCAAFPGRSDEDLALLCRKGVFPYEWFTGAHCMEERALPPIEAFTSRLSGETISVADYAHAQRVWERFGCRTFRNYHNLYLRCDVAQLADVFEAYRDVSLRGYGLDPVYYFSAPNMAWDAMFKKTGVELEQISDESMYEFFEKGMRGGISMISHRHARANNPYVTGYDAAQPSTYISYLDANNLYGWAMSRKLPHKDFRWETDLSRFTSEFITCWNAEGDKGYTLEVDVRYPEALHALHNDYPLLPEKMKAPAVSPYCEHMAELFEVAEGCEKLIPNLRDKERYVVHVAALQQALQLGLELTAVHRVISYTQSRWLKPFIDSNTAQRAKSSSDWEKDYWKLMNNSVFGKTMESVRGRIDLKVRTREDLFMKDVSSPNFSSFRIWSENLVASQKTKEQVKLDKPVYAGQAILDLSKTLMYDYWYGHLKPTYGDHVKLLATDTDSLIFQVQTEDFYKDMKKSSHLYDLSEYDAADERLGWMHSDENKKVVGKFKDETGVTPIAAFVGLKPKLYALRLEDGKEKKVCKGVKKAVVQRTISFSDYEQCVLGETPAVERKQVQIRSINHELHTLEIRKRALSCYDTKRWLLDDGITSLAHGHRLISSLA